MAGCTWDVPYGPQPFIGCAARRDEVRHLHTFIAGQVCAHRHVTVWAALRCAAGVPRPRPRPGVVAIGASGQLPDQAGTGKRPDAPEVRRGE